MTASVRGYFQQLPSGELVAVLEQCIGIDVTAARSAPLSEGIRFDIRLEDGDSVLGLELVERLLRGRLPLVERCMPCAVGKKPAEGVVVLGGEPGKSESLHFGRVLHEALR